MRWGAGAVLAGLPLLLGLAGTRTAAACSTLPPASALRGYPSDGEVEVPTNVVPFYDAASAYGTPLEHATFTLTSSAGESLTAQAARAQVATTELTIESELQPNTSYTLVASFDEPAGPDFVETLTLAFTTGAGPASSAPPAPPRGFLRHYLFADQPRSSCSPSEQGTCVAVSAGLPVEATNVDDVGQENSLKFLYRESWFTDLSGITQNTNFRCVKLRTRGANAVYSEPLVLCGADAPLFAIRGSENIGCTPQGLTQDGALVTSSAGAAQGGAGQGGAGGSPSASGAAGAGMGGADQVGAPASPSAKSSACNLAPGRKSSSNPALGALLALALATLFSRRARLAVADGREVRDVR